MEKVFITLFKELIAPCVVAINVFIASYMLLTLFNTGKEAALIASAMVAGWMYSQTPLYLNRKKKNALITGLKPEDWICTGCRIGKEVKPGVYELIVKHETFKKKVQCKCGLATFVKDVPNTEGAVRCECGNTVRF